MLPDDGSSSVTSTPTQMFPSMSVVSPYPWLKVLKSEERGLCLIHLLIGCAKHVASGKFEQANTALDQIAQLATPEGDTMQRIASYFAEALAKRIIKTWPGIYKALHSTKISSPWDSILARKLFFDYFPYLKMAFVISNQVIMEAMEGEKVIHVVDLNAVEPSQWHALLRDLSARPEGPPHLRITGVHQQKEVLDEMGRILMEEAEKLDVPFQFNPIVSRIEDVDVEKLKVKSGEAVAISSVLQFHSLLTSSAKIDGFMKGLRGLCPKVMMVVEQDSDHNNPGLMERVSECLYFYAALFDCLECTLPPSSRERLKLEKMVFGEEINNIIACEGEERKERHEKLERWVQRLGGAGFWRRPISYYGVLQARRLLQGHRCDGCRIKEDNACVVMYWQDRPLFSLSAWGAAV